MITEFDKRLTCVGCYILFVPRRANQRYCSPRCSLQSYKESAKVAHELRIIRINMAVDNYELWTDYLYPQLAKERETTENIAFLAALERGL